MLYFQLYKISYFNLSPPECNITTFIAADKMFSVFSTYAMSSISMFCTDFPTNPCFDQSAWSPKDILLELSPAANTDLKWRDVALNRHGRVHPRVIRLYPLLTCYLWLMNARCTTRYGCHYLQARKLSISRWFKVGRGDSNYSKTSREHHCKSTEVIATSREHLENITASLQRW